MFLYGMRLMGDSLKENSSGTLKVAMGKVKRMVICCIVSRGAVVSAVGSSSLRVQEVVGSTKATARARKIFFIFVLFL